jgi:hypothetical protein
MYSSKAVMKLKAIEMADWIVEKFENSQWCAIADILIYKDTAELEKEYLQTHRK